MALEVQVQRDFSGGMYDSPARELIPPNGCARILNGLLTEDGAIIRRGGSVLEATIPTPTAVWDGYLVGGARTVFASSGGIHILTGATTAFAGSSGTIASLRPAAANGILVFAKSAGGFLAYAGTPSVFSYLTGTINYTAGSKTVTGTGTTWVGNVDPGDFLGAVGVVESVQSNTSLTLRDNAASTATGATYVAVAQRAFGSAVATAVATVSNPARLVYSVGSRVYFSAAGDIFTFDPTDYHEMPQGAQILGMESLRNILFVFTSQGVFTIGGMDYDLTDAQGNVQHRLEQINRDIILWDQRGIAGWSGALVVPGVDDLYLITDSAAPRVLSAPIRRLYRSYVSDGYQCGGGAVYRNHYFLPVLDGANWIATLVCRLDTGAWTTWSGDAAQSTWFVTRGSSGASRSPKLFGAHGARFKDLSGTFSPSAVNKNDADGTTHAFEIETRDYTTGGLRKNLVKKVRLGYELTDSGSDNPVIYAGYGTTGDVTYSTLPDTATADDGSNPATFTVGTSRPKFVRFAFRMETPAAKLIIRSIEIFTRTGGRQ